MKKIGKILLAIICLFALSTKVKADEIGGGGAGRGGGAGTVSCSGTNVQCNNNKIGPYFKVTLYYIQQGAPWEQIGDSYYIAGSDAYADSLSAYNVARDHIIVISTVGTNATSKTRFKDGSKAIRCYYDLSTTSGNACSDAEDGIYRGSDNSNVYSLPNANLTDLLRKFTGKQDYASVLTKESQIINRETAATHGYRIIIEPVFLFFNKKKPAFAATPRQLAFEKQGNSSYSIQGQSYPVTKDFPNSSTKPTMLQALFTDYNDVGIANPGGESHKWSDIENVCSNMSYKNVSNNNGCGMNILDVGKKLQPHYCYDKKVTGSVSCEGVVDTESEGDFLETYTKRECTAKESQDNTNSEHGKRVAVSNSCALYARESGHVILPGGISKNNKTYNINNGSYFAWPAKKNHVGMHAIIKDVVDFTIVRTDGGACSDAEVNTLVEAAKSKIKGATFGLKLTGGDFDPINGQALVPANQQEWTNANITVNGNTRKFKLAKLSYMEINEATNRIYNRTLNKIFHRTSVLSKDEVDRGDGVVSLTINNKTTGTQKYKLELSNLVFGIDGGAFEVKNYSCQLETHREPCECPPGKLSKSLEDYVNAGRTCRQAQEEAERTGECEAFCYTSTGQKVNITNCVLNEIKKGTDEVSAQKICEDKEPSCRKTCLTEAGTYIPVNQYNSCITQTVAKGFSLTEAQEKCDNKLCGCVVDGKTPESYIACIDRGGSKNICTAMYCDKQHVCKQCMYCTTGCNWSEKKLTDSQVAFVKVCDNTYPGEADCGHRVITNKACVQQKLGVSDIITALNKGTKTVSELDDAIYECSDTYNVSTKRDNLVFRTIDLNNPFPGDSVKTTAYSNNSQTSRYPGSNWDSAITVKEDILEARGAKGDELYKKSPLYTITITPSQMKKIREYNKKQENPLSDFKLTCAEGTDYCYSDFLHGKAKDCEGNECLTINTDTQKSKCANIKNNKTDFINCYESKN